MRKKSKSTLTTKKTSSKHSAITTKAMTRRSNAARAKCPMPPREPPLPTSTIIPLEDSFKDARGYIQNLVSRDIGSAVLIFSEKGSVRAEHWHKKDAHWCFVLAGSLCYFERPVGSDALPKMTTVTAGQLFFTPPGVEHSMYFREPTTFLTFSRPKFDRSQKSYEADLVRLDQKLSEIAIIRATYIDPPQPTARELVQPEVVETASQDTPTPAPQNMPTSIQ
jgi:quercetin dioxygenase-like cupin family protein